MVTISLIQWIEKKGQCTDILNNQDLTTCSTCGRTKLSTYQKALLYWVNYRGINNSGRRLHKTHTTLCKNAKNAIFSIHSILLYCWFMLFVFWCLAVNCHKINWYFYAGYLKYLAERGRVRRCLLSLQLIYNNTNHKSLKVKCHHGLVDKVLYSLSLEASSHKIENALGEYSIHFHFTYICHLHAVGACLYLKN